MKKLMILFFALPLFVFAQQGVDTSQNKIVISQEDNDCVQTVYNDPNGITLLLKRINQDPAEMRRTHEALMNDPEVKRLIQQARTDMNTGSQDQGYNQDQNQNQNQTDMNQGQDQNQTMEQNQNNTVSPGDSTGNNRTDTGQMQTNGDVNTCVAKIHNNPDALKLLLSLVLGDREKFQSVKQQVMSDPELKSMMDNMKTEMHEGMDHDNMNDQNQMNNENKDQNNNDQDSTGIR